MQQPPSQVFFNTARPKGHQISGMWTELEERGSTAKRQQDELLDMIAYGGHHGTQGTVPVRRWDIGEDAGDRRSLAHGRFLSARTRYEAVQFPDPLGVWGQVVPNGIQAIDPHRPPDHGSRATNS